MVVKYGWNQLYVWVLAVSAALALTPTSLTIALGQINLVLLALVLTDFALLRSKSRYAGIGIGLAAAIKLTPLLFIVYLAATRRWRATLTAALSTAVATGVGFVVLPAQSWRYFSSVVFHVKASATWRGCPTNLWQVWSRG